MATTSPQSQSTIRQEVAATLKRLEAKDPGLKQLLKKAYGYAVFPTVGKAALVVGGAYGKGAVFEQGKFIGYATIGQTTIGVQIGGNTFTEVVAFENKQALERFKQGKVKFAANAAAVLVKAGAAGTADYEKGVQALAYSRGGMLLEAAIGGQKFGFKPAGGEEGGKQGQKGDKQGEKGSKGSKASRQTQEDQEEQDQSDEGDEQDDGDESASSGSGMLKGHPVMTTLIGTGIVAGIAILAVRALRQSLGGESSAEEGSEEAGDEDQEQDEDSDARMQNEEDDQDEEGQEEDQRDESEEDEEEDTETQGRSEDEGEEEEEGDEEEQQEPPRRSSRFASRR